MRDGYTSVGVNVQEILELLSSHALLEITRGIRLIGELGLSELSSYLLPFLRDSRYYELRAMSARSCGLLHFSDALSDLYFLAMHDEYEEVRREAVLAMGLVQDFSNLPVLFHCLSDEDEGVRENVLLVLENWEDRGKVLDGLILIVKDSTKPIVFRREALLALVRLRDASLFQLFASLLNHEDREFSRIAVEGLGALGEPRGLACLRGLLDDEDDDFRLSAYSALGNIVTFESAELLKAGLFDSYDYVRQEIARCMSKFSAKHALPILSTLINDDVVFVRSAAIRSLSSFSGSKVLELLSQAMTDSSASVRKEVAYSLGFQEPVAIEFIKELLHDTDDLVRIAAKMAMRRIAKEG